MDNNNGCPHHSESSTEHPTSDAMLGGRLTHGEQMGEQLDRVISEDQDDPSQLESVMHSRSETSYDTISIVLFVHANLLWNQFKQSDRPDDLEMAITLHRQALKLRPLTHPHRSESLNCLSVSVWTRFELLSRREDLEEAIELQRQALDLQSASHPRRSMTLSHLAFALSTRFEQLGQCKDMEEAILFHRQALKLRPSFHPERYMSLNHLALALLTLFEHLGKHEDLEEAVLLNREAIDLVPPSHPDRSEFLGSLADSLLKRFEHLGRHDDIEEAILLHQQALELRPASHPKRSITLNNLAVSLSTRFGKLGRDQDLEKAILFREQALELQPTPHPHQSTYLSNLASDLFTRFKRSGEIEDLEKAILLHRQALELRPASHPERSISLNNLAVALWTQFQQSGRREDLEEAILFHRQVVEQQPALQQYRYIFLNNFASALWIRYYQSGRHEDMEEAILLYREGLELRPPDQPDRSRSLDSLGLALCTRFEQLGRHGDLEEAILLHREALEQRPAFHPERSISLNNLAVSLSTRFWHLGRPEDLEEAILLRRKALELLPTSHPRRYTYLNNLASDIWTRFKQLGRIEDLEDAVTLYQEAIQLQPPSHPERSMPLDNLAATLVTRFMRLGRREDLEEAIVLHRRALELLPASHLKRSMYLDNLASTLLQKFTQLNQREYLEEAILLHQQALDLRPAPHPDRALSLHSLSESLLKRFVQSGVPEDLDTAIEMSHQSLQTLVSGHRLACAYFHQQGEIFLVAYSQKNESEYLHKAVKSFRSAVACEAATASLRFHVAKRWARLADFFRHDSALDAYRAAIRLLPRLAMLGLDLPSRQQALTSGSDGLARDAAACAIRSDQYDLAVELLEEGRAVFWSQALQLRTPMADLRHVAPELEEKLRHVSLALEQGSLRDVSRRLSDDARRVISMEQEASHFRRLNDEWLEIVEKVRHLEGFQDFLRPSRISTLLGAASKAPLVILNASNNARNSGCAALILTSTKVQHVFLPDLTFDNVTQLVELIKIATAPESRNAPLPESNRERLEDLVRGIPPLSDILRETLNRGGIMRVSWSGVIFRHVLAVLWESVVEPVVRRLGLEKSDAPSDLRWCPTGPFAFLPIHAAGMYDTMGSACISDYVISSYTPTISTLLRPPPLTSTPLKMIVVIQPELPYTVDELQRIEARVSATKSQVPVMELIKLESGTVEQVISHLPTTSIAHFACHGSQNAEKPLESALRLKDSHLLTVKAIMQQSSPNAMLAFLAACQTAMGDKNLPDEEIHLGSTLLFSGFSGVVATMWNIHDVDGPEVADTFYEYLFKETSSDTVNNFQQDTTRAARALHHAVTKLRSEKIVSFIRWVPFIHLGK